MLIDLKPSRIHGTGVFARDQIEKGDEQYVYGYVTTYVPGSLSEKYGFRWDDDSQQYIPYAPWCFVNHSKNPNCEVYATDFDVIIIQALRDIGPGEELTIDYGSDYNFEEGIC